MRLAAVCSWPTRPEAAVAGLEHLDLHSRADVANPLNTGNRIHARWGFGVAQEIDSAATTLWLTCD